MENILRGILFCHCRCLFFPQKKKQGSVPTSKKPSQRPRHSTPTMSSSPRTLSRSPLPKTPWTGPWQRRQTARTTRPCQTRRHVASSGIRTPDVEFGALHRCAPRVRRWTTLSLNKNAQPASQHIVLSVVSRVRCPVCRVSLLSHVSVVPCVLVLCVLPRLPDSDKKVFFFFFRDGLKKG